MDCIAGCATGATGATGAAFFWAGEETVFEEFEILLEISAFSCDWAEEGGRG